MNDLFSKPPAPPPTDHEPPPDIVETLAQFLQRWHQKNDWPECMPAGEHHAARWFIGLMEPPHEFRDIPEPRYHHGKRVGWTTPYHDRLLFALQKFMGFTEPQRVWIIEHIRAGIPWRGEDGKQYAGIIEHTQLMQQDPEAFIGNATQVLKKIREGRK